ncbi:MAG: Nif3-like dinuclear metal center hexameric protein [Bacillota bacterium]
MPVKAEDLCRLVEELAPLELAEEWDNPGLQLGDPDSEIHRVLLALDVDEGVGREAAEKGVQLVICHHPLFFKPLKNLRTDRPQGALLASLIRAGIAVYAAHTNLDNAARGVSDELARRLGLREASVLRVTYRQKFLKLVVFVPADHAEKVRAALGRAGAGWIGNYSECTFQVAGQGTFRPLEGTSPFIGRAGELAHVDEVRLETIVPVELAGQAVQAVLAAHPYEEAVCDLYPLANEGALRGTGRIGLLPRPMVFQEFCDYVKKVLGVEHLRCGGERAREIRRVAVCGGAGAELWPVALAAGADVLVTGDIGYHAAKDMLAAGMSFVDAGHYGTERVILPALREFLGERCRQKSWRVEIFLAEHQADPFAFR